ncbi:MAG: DinB family protein [Terracidiphilus sp.]
MKYPGKKLALILLAALMIPIAGAQDATAKHVAPTPALSPSQTLLYFWNYVGHKLTAMAEDFPEDKYDFKPNPAQRSFAEQLIHAAHGINVVVEIGKGVKPHLDDPKRSDFKNKAAVVEYVRKAFADGAALIASKGDSGMNDLVVDPWSNQLFRFNEQAWFYLEHSGEHYGQLVVYYRVAGLVPPESRPKK